MASKFDTWWQKNKKPLIIIAIVTIILLTTFALAVSKLGWDWTGFNGGYNKVSKAIETTSPPPKITRTEEYQPGKTLWDWMQLLLVPLMLAIGGFWLNQIQKNRDERATEQRDKIEREMTLQRDKTERELTLDKQREDLLQTYLDRIVAPFKNILPDRVKYFVPMPAALRPRCTLRSN